MPRWAYTNNSNFIQSVVFRIQRNKFTDKDKGNKIHLRPQSRKQVCKANSKHCKLIHVYNNMQQ